MWTLQIPGWKKLQIEYLVFDYNGTLAVDGKKLPGVDSLLQELVHFFEIHVVTADTFGLAAKELENLPCTLKILPKENQAEAKQQYIQKLGAEKTVAIGNGRNDHLMLKEAALGIVLLQEEGAAYDTLAAADVVCREITDALQLFLNPKRLIATLRG
jgi:soluble P-type ATPase